MISGLVTNTLVLLNRNSCQADVGRHLSVRHPLKRVGDGLSYAFNYAALGTTQHGNSMNLHFTTEVIRMKRF